MSCSVLEASIASSLQNLKPKKAAAVAGLSTYRDMSVSTSGQRDVEALRVLDHSLVKRQEWLIVERVLHIHVLGLEGQVGRPECCL